MRSAIVFSALLGMALAAPAPAPRPQEIDYAGVDAAPDPVLVSPAYDVEQQAAPARKRNVVIKKRDGDCSPQPKGYGPVASPDTPEAFLSNPVLAAMASNAPTPDGYSNVFTNLDGSLSAPKYMGLTTLTSFDTLECASLCDQASGCVAFNMYIERDPSVDTNAVSCPDPPSVTNYKCTLWGVPVVPEEANNKGQYRNTFHVVITASNAYNKASPPPEISGFDGPTALGGAINAPVPTSGQNSYMGYKYFPFNQAQGYNTATCAAACTSETDYNSRHPAADGTYQRC
ncbi:MAG: hypothetical protein Q9187_001051, partial [Circinaria calcarea]